MNTNAYTRAFILFIKLWEREAGYHLISLALILTGVCLVDKAQRPQIAHDLVVFGTGVLARSMGGAKKPAQP